MKEEMARGSLWRGGGRSGRVRFKSSKHFSAQTPGSDKPLAGVLSIFKSSLMALVVV